MLEKIENANAESLRRMLRADPVLVDVQPAGKVIKGLGEGVILHSGPPIAWEPMCGPMQGAVCGIAVFEGWADDLRQAQNAATAGHFTFHPNHHFGAVGPMTGMTTVSQPVFIVENRAFGNRAFCTINEGLGKVMRFGGNDAEVLNRLRWIADVLGPVLSAALRQCAGIPLKGLIARGLAMGDEMHQRNVACSSLFLREIAPSLAVTVGDSKRLAEIFAFIAGNDQFFLNITMAMAKAITDPAKGITGSTVVTSMCRNGTDFGVQVSATGDDWFTAPVEVQAFLREDANLQIDRPVILLKKRQHPFKPAQADAGIDFEMRAHMGGALQDRLFKRAHGTGMNILGREHGLRPRGFGDRLFDVALFRLHTIKDARFVEMDVGLDEARRNQPTAEIDDLTLSGEAGRDRGDPSTGDADVGQLVLGAEAPRVLENDVHYFLARSTIPNHNAAPRSPR